MEDFFNVCIEEAKISSMNGDVPVGAVLVQNGKIIACAHNTREKEHNILGHAEINVILVASKLLKRWNLADCDMYVTLEPCSMCNVVIKQSRIQNVYYLLKKPANKKEFSKTNFVYFQEKALVKYEQMYASLLSDFFKAKRG